MIGETFYKINSDSRSGDFSKHPFLCFVVKGVDKEKITDLNSNRCGSFDHVLVLNEFHYTTSAKIVFGSPMGAVRINIGDLLLPSEYKGMRDILAENGYHQKDSKELKWNYIDLCALHTEDLVRRNKSLQLEIQKNQETIKKLKDEIL